MKKLYFLSLTAFIGIVGSAQNNSRSIITNLSDFMQDQPISVNKNVNPSPTATACDTLNWPIPVSWTSVYYTTGVGGSGGFVNGPNQYADKEKANYFDASTNPYSKLQGMLIGFSHVYTATPSKIVTIKIYDGTSGTPGALIGSQNMTMAQIMAFSSQNYYTRLIFNPAITLPASKRFFISVDISNLSWMANPKDSLSVNSNQDPQSNPTTTWEKQSNNIWYRYDDVVNSWNLGITLYIFPFLTNTPYAIGYNQTPSSATNICSGSSVNFDASPSIIGSGLLWNFQGGLPATSNTVVQSVQYPAAGTYLAKLYILGGGCDVYDSLSSNVNVIASPILSPTATPNTICPPQTSSALTVNGANTYVWTPASSLSSSTGSAVISTPTATTTYTITGTASNGCTSQASVIVTLGASPVANVTNTTGTICVGGNVAFNGSGSTNVTTYSWVFPGGTPASSNSQSPTITYNSPGTFLAHLYAINNCGTDSSYSLNVSVGCVGISGVELENSINTFFNSSSAQLELNIINSALNGNYSISIVNAIGQEVYSTKVSIAGNYSSRISMNGNANGIYFIRISGDNAHFARKFIK